MFDGLVRSIKRNHFAQMAICCMLPVVLIVALQAAGFSGFWIYPLALAVCIGSHIAMTYAGMREGKSCH